MKLYRDLLEFYRLWLSKGKHLWFSKGKQNPTCFIKATSFLAKRVDQKILVGIILMDLSKAYDCMPHDLLIAKLECYEIDKIRLP